MDSKWTVSRGSGWQFGGEEVRISCLDVPGFPRAGRGQEMDSKSAAGSEADLRAIAVSLVHNIRVVGGANGTEKESIGSQSDNRKKETESPRCVAERAPSGIEAGGS